MKAKAIFIHARHPRAALQLAADQFMAVQTKSRSDIQLADEILGDLTMSKLRACFNITRETLVHLEVLGRFSTLRAAIGATTGNEADDLKLIAGGRRFA